MEDAWRDQRRSSHPKTFPEATTLLRDLVATRSDLLITPEYSNTAASVPVLASASLSVG